MFYLLTFYLVCRHTLQSQLFPKTNLFYCSVCDNESIVESRLKGENPLYVFDISLSHSPKAERNSVNIGSVKSIVKNFLFICGLSLLHASFSIEFANVH
jgi:hypothetical protein